MKFAKVVFYVASVWGVLVLTPLYFMFDVIGRQDPPPITHPAFYFGFIGAGLAWQVVFYLIATNPLRFRAMMIPAVLEKLTYGLAVSVLFIQKRMNAGDLLFSSIDLVFAMLFVVSFLKTKSTT
jgi:hypothetical protein